MFHNNENPLEPEYTPLEQNSRYPGTYGTGPAKQTHHGSRYLMGILVLAVLMGTAIPFLRWVRQEQRETRLPETSTVPTGEYLNGSTVNRLEPLSPDGNTGELKLPQEAVIEPDKLEIGQSSQAQPNIPQAGGLSLQEIYSKVSPSAVSVTAVSQGGSSFGSGIIMSESGYIITNCHVIQDAQKVGVTLHDGGFYEAVLIGKDAVSDLAVLQIYAKDLVPAQFGDSDAVQVGDMAVAIGDPLGLELRGTMTEGIISAINRNITLEGRAMTLLQTTAALNEGNSGGPLINCYGQVVGINTAKIGSYYNSGVEALGFAIPINTAKEIIDQLISIGYVPGRPSLGVETTVLGSQYRFFYDLPAGLYITAVPEDSHAWSVGLRRGDTITSVAGEPVTNQESLNAILSKYEAGDAVSITIYRSRRQYEGQLILQEAGG